MNLLRSFETLKPKPELCLSWGKFTWLSQPLSSLSTKLSHLYKTRNNDDLVKTLIQQKSLKWLLPMTIVVLEFCAQAQWPLHLPQCGHLCQRVHQAHTHLLQGSRHDNFLGNNHSKHFLGIIFSKVMALLVSLGLFHALVAMSIIIIFIWKISSQC